MRVGNELVLLKEGVAHAIHTPEFTYFSHLSITEDGTMYTIASGPRTSSSLLKIDPVRCVLFR